jgi:hypothetical protein
MNLADLLLDQTFVAGVGNKYKSELLYPSISGGKCRDLIFEVVITQDVIESFAISLNHPFQGCLLALLSVYNQNLHRQRKYWNLLIADLLGSN